MTDAHMYNLAEVDAMVKVIVESKPEGFKYDDEYPKAQFSEDQNSPLGCSYFVDNAPACIVGQVFHRVGLGPADVREGEGTSLQTCQVNELFTSDALSYLDLAQAIQDTGKTWREAYEGAHVQWIGR